MAAEEENEYSSYLEKMKKFLTVKRDLLKQKYLSAKGSSISQQRLERYSHSLKTLNKLKNSNYESISFEEWLVLGGRWVLNGEPEQNIIFVKMRGILNAFEKKLKHIIISIILVIVLVSFLVVVLVLVIVFVLVVLL